MIHAIRDHLFFFFFKSALEEMLVGFREGKGGRERGKETLM